MIAFGSAVTRPDIYERCAAPGIRRAAEADSAVHAPRADGSIFVSYNKLLDWASGLQDLEALVLVHQDAEIVGDDFPGHVRQALSDPDVGIVGCVGAVGVRSIAWWEGSVTLASFTNRYEELGGGELPALSWSWADAPPYAHTGPVETLDGFMMVLSPWAVRTLRFDEQLSDFHGYDLDFCLQVREAGRKVVTADLRAIHHRPLEMIPDPAPWVRAHIAVAEKWDGRMPGIGGGAGTWEERVRRAEAGRDAAWSIAHSTALEQQARVQELQRGIDITRESISWRLTAPLRWFGRRRTARATAATTTSEMPPL